MIKNRARLIIIKNDHILLSRDDRNDYYFYIGGKVDPYESIKQTAIREVREEADASFTFGGILYIIEYINAAKDEHNIEFFIWGDIDKFKEIEDFREPDKPHLRQVWIPLDQLPHTNVKPDFLTPRILADYLTGFANIPTQYLGPHN